jgi:glycosyltransferase involved in cell wall biosynthesis
MTINGSGPNHRAFPPAPFTLSDAGRNVAKGHIAIDPEPRWDGADVPLVSCLMVTTDRPRLAARAVECFLAQSYPNRELIVIDGSESDELQQGIEAICYPPIKPHRERPAGRSMGELRDLAVKKSSGQYVCIWDDDDLYDPDRLSIQMGAITTLGADACFLARLQLWWPARRFLAVSIRRMWEGTTICAKDKMPLYPPLRRGEDTPVAYRLWRSQRVVMLDEPRLYTYVFHGANITGESHFAAHCGAATQQWTGDAYADRMAILGARVPIDVDEPASTQNENYDTRSSSASSIVPTTDITLSADTR